MSIRFKTFITELNVIPGNATAVVQGIAGRFPNTVKRATGSDLGFVVNAKKEDKINTQKPEAKRKLETDALKKVVRSDEYRNASEEERSKMLETGISSIGDNPSIEGSDAEFRVRQDQRAKNIDRDVKARLAAMTPEEKEVEFNRAEADSAARSAARYEQGRKAAEGGQLSGMDDVRAMKDFFAKNRRDRNRNQSEILSQADRDIASMDKDPSTIYQGIDKLSNKTKPELDSFIKSKTPRQRARFVLGDQGVDVNDPTAVQREADRRSQMGDRYRNQSAIAKGQRIAKASFGKQP